MKNSFLAKLKSELALSGIPIEIAGEILHVRRPTAAQYRDFIVRAELEAKDALEPHREKMQARPATESEKGAFRSIVTDPGAASECSTEYDYRLLTLKFSTLSRVILEEVLYLPDGTKPWSSEEEKAEVLAALAATPGAEEKIMAAMQAEQKKSPQLIKPSKPSGKGQKLQDS